MMAFENSRGDVQCCNGATAEAILSVATAGNWQGEGYDPEAWSTLPPAAMPALAAALESGLEHVEENRHEFICRVIAFCKGERFTFWPLQPEAWGPTREGTPERKRQDEYLQATAAERAAGQANEYEDPIQV